MLAWEQRPDESAKAYSAFQLFRDLGPNRTLRQVATLYYRGTTESLPTNGQLANIKKWSARYDWIDRVRSLEARDEMIRREAIEAHFKTVAADFAERQVALRKQWLEIAEKAAQKSKNILEWPLAEQRVEREVDGEVTQVIFLPSRWSLNTAKTLHDLSVNAATGFVEHKEEDEEVEYDLSDVTEEEIEAYLDIDRKIRSRAKRRTG